MYQAAGWLPQDPILGGTTGSVYFYNPLTDTGYLMMDLDRDANNTFDGRPF
jgi:hypothetical protein